LRGEIGYDGVVFSDDLEMKAVRDLGSRALVRGALEAGVDGVLVCREIGLVREVLGLLERMPDALVETPLRRMHELKQRFAGKPAAAPAGPPYPAHRELATRIRERRLDDG
jgi:beta-N-acetylhexosaminidase